MYTFVAGKGVNVVKLNDNFDEVKTDANDNESALTEISNTALLKDGSNLTQEMIDIFNQDTPTILSTTGTISLVDNSVNFLTLTGNGTISLPSVAADQYSHTIILTVAGGNHTLNLGTTKHLSQNVDLDTENPYNVMYIYNKLDSSWYYCLTQ